MKGVCGGAKFLVLPYYSQRTVFASPLSAFFIAFCFDTVDWQQEGHPFKKT